MKSRHFSRSASGDSAKTRRRIGWSCLCCVLAAAALTLAASFGCLLAPNPLSVIPYAACAVLLLSAFICGGICAKIWGGGFVTGVVAGAVLSCCFLLLGLMLQGEGETFHPQHLLWMLSAVFCAGGGGFIISRRQKTKSAASLVRKLRKR